MIRFHWYKQKQNNDQEGEILWFCIVKGDNRTENHIQLQAWQPSLDNTVHASLIIQAKVYAWSTVRQLVNTSDKQTLAITRSASWLNKKIVFLQLKNYAMENPHFKDEYKK